MSARRKKQQKRKEKEKFVIHSYFHLILHTQNILYIQSYSPIHYIFINTGELN
jgi:hypothetical protein